MKKIFFVLKKVVVAISLLYSFNLIISGLNILIPINLITIFVVSFLGISGLISLVALYFVLF